MARILDQLIGHTDVVGRLMKNNERLAATMVFAGLPGIGKMQVALAVAQTFLCRQSEMACGECGACLRVEQRQSESLLIVEPENQQIKIAAAHDVIQFLALQGGPRAVIVNRAHLLNPQASNALLKTLEEPTINTQLILLTEAPHALLPTIRSRCQFFHFSQLNLQDMQKLFPDASPQMLSACRGQPEKMQERLDPSWSKTRDSAFEFIEACIYAYPLDSIKVLCESKEQLLQSLTFMQQFLHDEFLLRQGAVINAQSADWTVDRVGLIHPDLQNRMQQWKLTDDIFRKFSVKLYEQEKAVSSNIDRQLLLETTAIYFSQLRPPQ